MKHLTCLVVLAVSSVAWSADADVKVDAKTGTIRFAATVAKQGRYDVLKGSIEYLLVAKGGKDYETVFVTDVAPQALADVFVKLGLKPGRPADGKTDPTGTPVRIFVEITTGRKTVRHAAEDFILLKETGKPLEPGTWTFTGSRKVFNPETERDDLEAVVTRSLIGLHRTDASPLIQNPRREAIKENIYTANAKALPKPGTAVTLVVERVKPPSVKGMRRVHLFISGRVQGVGFRNFTRRSARRLKLTGWVKNLRDGRVEAVVEGPADDVAKLIEQVKRGPRHARVDDIKITDGKPTGKFKTFRVTY